MYDLTVKADGYSKGVDRRSQEGVLKELIGQMIMCRKA